MSKRNKKNKNKLTQAITHIPLQHLNANKLEALNQVAEVYLALCQQYVSLFCEHENPDPYAQPDLPSELSQRWQRVAIMQAAGIAQSWLTNRDKAYAEYESRLAWFEKKYPTLAEQDTHANKMPHWKPFNLPNLKKMKIGANHNVAQLTENDDLPLSLEKANGSQFDFWIRISTLEKRRVIWLPIELAKFHKKKLEGHQPNRSVTLERDLDGRWWLTITIDRKVKPKQPTAEPVGIDVGINSFLTTNTGKHYGTFQGDLNQRFEADREKRRRKAKLRSCLQKKGVAKLPSTASKSGDRLHRHTIQSINKAVKDCFEDHPDSAIVLEDLSVSTMRFKSKRMNAKLYASNLAHIPKHIKWVAQNRGLPTHTVNSAYSSQECSQCHFTDRTNRPNQQTFCCQACGFRANADEAAAVNLVNRLHDTELEVCHNLDSVKQLLHTRHQHWCEVNGYP